MSILDFPRLNFRGQFVTNPCTANNDDVVPAVVTRDTNSLGEDMAGMNDDQASQYLSGCVKMQNYDSPPGVKPFIRAGWNPNGDHATTFENTTIQSVVYSAGKSASTSAADPMVGVSFEIIGTPNPNGSYSSRPMICDLDPTGLVTTQLYVGGIRFSYTDDKGQLQKIDALHDTRAYQDWLNFFSTVSPAGYGGEQDFVGIACMWQFVIPAAKLPTYASFGLTSPGLQALLQQAQSAGGLAIRFRCYEVEPGLTGAYLNYQIQQGQVIANPAYGYLVGTIGIWNSDEPQSEPAGRKLEATYRAASPTLYIDPTDPDQGRPAMSWATGPVSVKSMPTIVTLPGGQYPWWNNTFKGSPPPALIGNVVVKVQQNPPVISLDLIETFPKLGFRNPKGPVMPTNLADPAVVPQGFDQPKQMAYVGDVELAVIPAGGTEADAIRVADIDYGFGDYSKYEDFGGIVDVAYDASLYPTIAQGQLILRGNANDPAQVNAGVSLVKETIIRMVTDDRAAYMPLQDGESEVIANYPVKVKVYERGGPTTADVSLYLNEYKNIVQLKNVATETCAPANGNQYRTNQSVDSRTAALTAPYPTDNNPQQCPPTDIQPEPARLNFPASVTIPKGTTDWYSITVTPNQSADGGATVLALQPGNYVYGTIPPSSPGGQSTLGVAGVPMWSNATYSAIRVYEYEDFSALYAKPGGLQWADVYENALRYYFLLFPAMSAMIPLNLESSITSPYAANLIKQRLNTPNSPMFYSTLNMPVTRTMSPPRIKLILDFIDQQSSKASH